MRLTQTLIVMNVVIASRVQSSTQIVAKTRIAPNCTHVPHRHIPSYNTKFLLERPIGRIQGVDLRLVVPCNLPKPHYCASFYLIWEGAFAQGAYL
jgi:hypothetical protein